MDRENSNDTFEEGGRAAALGRAGIKVPDDLAYPPTAVSTPFSAHANAWVRSRTKGHPPLSPASETEEVEQPARVGSNVIPLLSGRTLSDRPQDSQGRSMPDADRLAAPHAPPPPADDRKVVDVGRVAVASTFTDEHAKRGEAGRANLAASGAPAGAGGAGVGGGPSSSLSQRVGVFQATLECPPHESAPTKLTRDMKRVMAHEFAVRYLHSLGARATPQNLALLASKAPASDLDYGVLFTPGGDGDVVTISSARIAERGITHHASPEQHAVRGIAGVRGVAGGANASAGAGARNATRHGSGNEGGNNNNNNNNNNKGSGGATPAASSTASSASLLDEIAPQQQGQQQAPATARFLATTLNTDEVFTFGAGTLEPREFLEARADTSGESSWRFGSRRVIPGESGFDARPVRSLSQKGGNDRPGSSSKASKPSTPNHHQGFRGSTSSRGGVNVNVNAPPLASPAQLAQRYTDWFTGSSSTGAHDVATKGTDEPMRIKVQRMLAMLESDSLPPAHVTRQAAQQLSKSEKLRGGAEAALSRAPPAASPASLTKELERMARQDASRSLESLADSYFMTGSMHPSAVDVSCVGAVREVDDVHVASSDASMQLEIFLQRMDFGSVPRRSSEEDRDFVGYELRSQRSVRLVVALVRLTYFVFVHGRSRETARSRAANAGGPAGSGNGNGGLTGVAAGDGGPSINITIAPSRSAEDDVGAGYRGRGDSVEHDDDGDGDNDGAMSSTVRGRRVCTDGTRPRPGLPPSKAVTLLYTTVEDLWTEQLDRILTRTDTVFVLPTVLLGIRFAVQEVHARLFPKWSRLLDGTRTLGVMDNFVNSLCDPEGYMAPLVGAAAAILRSNRGGRSTRIDPVTNGIASDVAPGARAPPVDRSVPILSRFHAVSPLVRSVFASPRSVEARHLLRSSDARGAVKDLYSSRGDPSKRLGRDTGDAAPVGGASKTATSGRLATGGKAAGKVASKLSSKGSVGSGGSSSGGGGGGGGRSRMSRMSQQQQHQLSANGGPEEAAVEAAKTARLIAMLSSAAAVDGRTSGANANAATGSGDRVSVPTPPGRQGTRGAGGRGTGRNVSLRRSVGTGRNNNGSATATGASSSSSTASPRGPASPFGSALSEPTQLRHTIVGTVGSALRQPQTKVDAALAKLSHAADGGGGGTGPLSPMSPSGSPPPRSTGHPRRRRQQRDSTDDNDHGHRHHNQKIHRSAVGRTASASTTAGGSASATTTASASAIARDPLAAAKGARAKLLSSLSRSGAPAERLYPLAVHKIRRNREWARETYLRGTREIRGVEAGTDETLAHIARRDECPTSSSEEGSDLDSDYESDDADHEAAKFRDVDARWDAFRNHVLGEQAPAKPDEDTRGLLAAPAEHDPFDPMRARRRKSIAMASRQRSSRGVSPPPSPRGSRQGSHNNEADGGGGGLDAPDRPKRTPSSRRTRPVTVVTPAHKVIADMAADTPRRPSSREATMGHGGNDTDGAFLTPSRAPLPPPASPTLLTPGHDSMVPFHERLSQPKRTHSMKKSISVADRHHHFAARHALRPSAQEEMSGQRRAFREQRAASVFDVPDSPDVSRPIHTLKSKDSILRKQIER